MCETVGVPALTEEYAKYACAFKALLLPMIFTAFLFAPTVSSLAKEHALSHRGGDRIVKLALSW